MKKIIGLLLTMLLVFTLAGCDDITIEPDIIAIQYENARWEDDIVVIDVWITNGTDEDFEMDYMEFALFFPDEEREFCGAGFDIIDTVKSDGWVSYEIEFSSDLIFYEQSDLDAEGIDLNDLVLYFWYED